MSDFSSFTPAADARDDASCAVDVAIVGGGLAGSIAATQLGRLGLRVALFDLHEAPKPEFRAEQIVGPQVGRLAELGLLGAMTRDSAHQPTATNSRNGRLLDRTRVDQYGVPYQAMVAGVRTQLPPTVRFIGRRVASLDTGPAVQTIGFGDGETLTARLVVVATGLSSVLIKRLGIETRMIRAAQSLALGFDVRLGKPKAPLPLIYYGEDPRDRVDYLAVFPMHDVLRANLFCYHEQQSDWTRAFCREPDETLNAVLPGLRAVVGDVAVTSSVQVRSNDLRVAVDPARDGVVLIGDAFQTPCPSAGTGIDRLLSDVDILCGSYIPDWLATPGMGQRKIARFYADPAKQAVDAECLRVAGYRRAVSTTQSLRWTVHRKQVFFRRRMKALLASRSAPASQASMAPSI